MQYLMIFIGSLGCMVFSNVVTGILLTQFYSHKTYSTIGKVEQHYLFYIVSAIILTLFYVLLIKTKNRLTK